MQSKWYKLKPEAIRLRRNGFSFRQIEEQLGIPRSTLSGWLKKVELSSSQKKKLLQNWTRGLASARKKAVIWHNEQKTNRLHKAEKGATETIQGIDLENENILELALAVLYLGEGFKKNIETGMGGSDPIMMKFFVALLKKLYAVPTEKIRCELYLRYDQDPKKIKRFWAKQLSLPLSCFRQINVDKRTMGSKTYTNYNGVCSVRCGNVAIQRKLIYLSNIFCKKVSDRYLGT